ncbi:MAG TPA: hypothetical protein VFC09_01345 [Candidatus Dormibacteraeota bacterium]|nr:hypothetical protein [Candidatus Dormibacteraeota bacterium]
MPSSAVAPAPAPPRRRPVWGVPLVVVAVAVVAVAAVIGVRGLLGDPVRSVGAGGVATLSGSWEPVSCDSGCVQGYVQAGARSVFLRLPGGCREPGRDQSITVTARPDPSLGKQAYLALDCPSR